MPVDKIMDPSAAASLYAKTSNVAQKPMAGGDDSVSFSDFLKQQVSESKADLTDVVQAVTSAELTLQTVVAVRDRLIAAYQEIMRMPI
jgi:flagellar hook-basal body complex protein FliE